MVQATGGRADGAQAAAERRVLAQVEVQEGVLDAPADSVGIASVKSRLLLGDGERHRSPSAPRHDVAGEHVANILKTIDRQRAAGAHGPQRAHVDLRGHVGGWRDLVVVLVLDLGRQVVQPGAGRLDGPQARHGILALRLADGDEGVLDDHLRFARRCAVDDDAAGRLTALAAAIASTLLLSARRSAGSFGRPLGAREPAARGGGDAHQHSLLHCRQPGDLRHGWEASSREGAVGLQAGGHRLQAHRLDGMRLRRLPHLQHHHLRAEVQAVGLLQKLLLICSRRGAVEVRCLTRRVRLLDRLRRWRRRELTSVSQLVLVALAILAATRSAEARHDAQLLLAVGVAAVRLFAAPGVDKDPA
mmetsp:Transcript_41605/g.107642  ORF Transcript_41605/g.107642 Transcript_41605/m.107642 type:complete len:360 (-) Transcript_41605:306-1385(-)